MLAALLQAISFIFTAALQGSYCPILQKKELRFQEVRELTFEEVG